MMAANKNFYLGKIFDREKGKSTDEVLYYDPSHLVTHAVITGMTGSGKTGLGIGLLEEAALHGYPAIIVDPKGDLTNLVLHFPDFNPREFEPWIDEESARREGKSIAQKAEETAATWKKGLADWGLGEEDIKALANAVEFSIYTPGSTSGIPVNILSSFNVPPVSWDENREMLRDFISSTVSGLLSLVGFNDIDPLRSREHILISNLMENAWSKGESLTLTDLILQTKNPPIERLGAFTLDSFFPLKDRRELAMLLNNFLASPSFQTWMEGQTLDIGQLLYTPEGKPRHSIFYLSHLDDSTRMFFVTMLFASIETWMRSKRGTGGLRALVYFDEVLGYLPPVQNPSSKPVLIRLLKQARAYGIGLVLATQNPVDLDYKALANMGTWIIGRLQTERDKARLLDGLKSAAGTSDIGQIDQIISSLGKRVFLLHNVHDSKPKVFQTRWVMNYLAGPLTQSQIPGLNKMVNARNPDTQKSYNTTDPSPVEGTAETQPQVEASRDLSGKYFNTRPLGPPGIPQYYFPNEVGISKAITNSRLSLQDSQQAEGLVYKPLFLTQAQVRYTSSKYGVDFVRRFSALIEELRGNLIHWEECTWKTIQPDLLHSQPLPNQGFAILPAWMNNERQIKSMQADFADWIYRNGTIQIRANETLKVFSGVEESEEDFRKRCEKAADAARRDEEKRQESTNQTKLKAAERKVERQKIEVDQAQNVFKRRGYEEVGTHGEFLLSLISKRRRSVSSSMTKRRLTSQSKDNLDQKKQELEMFEKDLANLQKEFANSRQDLEAKWALMVDQVTEIPLTPFKKDIFSELHGILWMPHYLVKDSRGDLLEIPAYER